MSPKCFVNQYVAGCRLRPVFLQEDSPLAMEFQEVPCEVRTAEVEKIGGVISATRIYLLLQCHAIP